MAEIGTMKDIYTMAQYVRIPGEAIDRFVKTLEAAGYEIRHKEAPQPEANTLDTLDWERLRGGQYRALNPDNQPLFDRFFAQTRGESP